MALPRRSVHMGPDQGKQTPTLWLRYCRLRSKPGYAGAPRDHGFWCLYLTIIYLSGHASLDWWCGVYGEGVARWFTDLGFSPVIFRIKSLNACFFDLDVRLSGLTYFDDNGASRRAASLGFYFCWCEERSQIYPLVKRVFFLSGGGFVDGDNALLCTTSWI